VETCFGHFVSMPTRKTVVSQKVEGESSTDEVLAVGGTQKMQPESDAVEPAAMMCEPTDDVDEELEELWKGFQSSMEERLDNVNSEAEIDEQVLTNEQLLIVKQREEIMRLRRENQSLKEVPRLPQRIPRGKPKFVAKPMDTRETRTYMVIDQTAGCDRNWACLVYAEPHLNAKIKMKKSRGACFLCSGITMNGWLKLENDDGWVLPNSWGLDGLEEVARPVPENLPMTLAVNEYEPQGLCSFKVLTKSHIYATASRNAASVGMRRRGEYVFAQLQNFNGWIQLAGAGECGWMPMGSEDSSEEILHLRRAGYTHILALCDLWSAARLAQKGNMSADVACMLEDIEEQAQRSVMIQCSDDDLVEKFFRDGMLEEKDLEESGVRLRQLLFAKALVHRIHKDRVLSKMIPDFQLSTRVVPLPDSSMDVGESVDIESCDSLMSEGPTATDEDVLKN